MYMSHKRVQGAQWFASHASRTTSLLLYTLRLPTYFPGWLLAAVDVECVCMEF